MRVGWRRLALLAALVVLAGGVRWVAMRATDPVRLIGDENYYGMTALQIARGRGHIGGVSSQASRAWRPPAHSYLLSLLADPDLPLTEPSLRGYVRRLLLLQVGFGAGLVGLTALLGRALFDDRVGWIAGAIAALYPAFIAHSHYLWSETLFAVLVIGALPGVVEVERRRSWLIASVAGVAFGIATLTRETALPVAAVAAIWWVWTAEPAQRRRARLQGALMLALAILVVMPWTVRNYLVLDRFVPVSTVGWFAAGEGNTLEHPNWLQPRGPAQRAFHSAYYEIVDEGERLDFARRYTLERIAAEQPTWILKKTVRNLAQLWSPDSVLLYKLRRGAYGEVPAWIERTATLVSVLTYAAVLTGGVLGIAAARGTGRQLLPCLILGVVVALHVFANATARFRVPWMPLLIVYASYAVARGHNLRRDLAGRRWIAPAGVLLFFFAVCFPYFVVFGGRQ